VAMYGLWKSKMYYMCGETPPAETASTVDELAAIARQRGWVTPALIAIQYGGEWAPDHWVYAKKTKPVSDEKQSRKYYDVRIGIVKEWPHRLGLRPTDDGLT